MGGGFSFKFRTKSGVARASGTIVGMSGEEDVDVEVGGHPDLADGTYSVPASKGEAVKAVIQDRGALKGVKAENIDVADDDTVIDNIEDLRRDSDAPKEKSYSPPPEKSLRDGQDKFVNVTVSPDEYRDMVQRKVQAIIDKYVPEEMRDAPAAVLIETIMKGMGVSNGSGLSLNEAETEKTIDEQLDEIVNSLHSIYADPDKGGYTGNADNHQMADIVEDLRERLASGFYAKDKMNEERIRKVVSTVDVLRAAVPGSPEHEELKNDVALGVLRALAATEEMITTHPHMKGVIALKLENWKHRVTGATATAGLRTDRNGRLVVTISYGEFALSSVEASLMSYGSKYEGSLNEWVVDVELFSGKETGYSTGTHENVHARHFVSLANRLGVQTGSGAEPILKQLIDSGKLQNTVFGVFYAFDANKRTSQEIDLGENDKYMTSSRTIASGAIAKRLNTARKKTNQTNDDPRDILDSLFGESGYGLGGVAEVLAEAIGLRDDEYSIGSSYRVSDEISDPASTRRFVEGVLGMSPEDFVRELDDSLTSDLGGTQASALGSNGVSEQEILEALGIASGYANTDISEAVAEASTLLQLIDSIKNVNLNGSEEKIQRMRDVIARLFAGESQEPSGLKKTSERTKQLLSLYDRLVDAVRALEWDYQ
jgi:hypothetical protein